LLLYLCALQDIYYPDSSSPDDLFEEAAQAAPVSAWRKAAAAAEAARRLCGGHNGSNGSSGRDGGGGGGSSSAGIDVRELQGSLQTLRTLTRKALRATAVAAHLLQQQQQQQEETACKQQQDGLQISCNGSDTAFVAVSSSPMQLSDAEGRSGSDMFEQGQEAWAARRATLLNHLGVLLHDQAVCLGPWFEPWRFRPRRDGLRLLTLQAAEVGGAAVQQGYSAGPH
jgi:hypothetical protein